MNPIITFPVIRVTQNIGEFYIASMKASDLVNISYSDVRRLAAEKRDIERYLGIQRPIKENRIKQLKEYIKGRDATFHTSVIIAIDENCAELNEDESGHLTLDLHPFYPEPGSDEEAVETNKIAKVIDGQHRIAAFMDDKDNWTFDFDNDDNFEINVSIFIGADVADQANVFATVNLAQTKVNKSLVYDLTELAKTPSPIKTCHNVAVMLDAEPTSPFFERIKRLGTATPGRHREPLTQASFVESLVKFISNDPQRDRNLLLDGKSLKKLYQEELVELPFRNLFIDGKDFDIAEIIYNFFKAVGDKWPESWENYETPGNLLPRSNAFKAFMKFLKEDIYPEIIMNKKPSIPTMKDFRPYLDNNNFEDGDFTTQVFAPGSSGQSTFLKMLRGEISKDDLIEANR